MTKERTGRVWDEMRRALGRMAGRVTTHGIPDLLAGTAVQVRHSTATDVGDIILGARQEDWQPMAHVVSPEAPAAQAGANGADLAAVPTVIGTNRALTAGDLATLAIPCLTTEPAVHSVLQGMNAVGVPPIQGPPVKFGLSSLVSPVTALTPPTVRSLHGVWAIPTKPPRERAAARRWQFGDSRVREGMAAILRTPMTRSRLPARDGVDASSAFAAERALLAAGAGVSTADVALIGVFPQVPLWAVQHLSVGAGGGALQILVRPAASNRPGPPPVVTVILGRQRSTGKTLQAVRRETQGV